MADQPGAQEINDLLEDLFTTDGALHAPNGTAYELISEVEHLIAGRLVRFRLRHKDLVDDREVTLFSGIDEVVGELWEHEVRNLLRLRMLGHPALPEIEDGKFDRTKRLAFIMTRVAGTLLFEQSWSTVREWATTYPVAAFEQFGLLVDALSRMHSTRIVHRNLTLGAIRVTQVADRPAQATLSLTRFELSALLNNLLHSVSGPETRKKHSEATRALFLTPPQGVSRAQHLAYLAPETCHAVVSDSHSRRPVHGSTDVFGLGVLGWELFVGSLTELLPDECAAVESAETGRLPERLARLHEAMRRELRVSTRVPQPLRTALLDMLDQMPVSRSSSFEASAALQRHWSAISTMLAPETGARKPRLVAFMPDQSVVTIHENRGWTDHRPDTPEGRQELQNFLAEELREAELIHRPGGAKGFVKGDPQSLAEAQWVLIGDQAVWFCAHLFDEDLMARRSDPHLDTLVIKYLVDKRYAADLLTVWPRRRIGRFDLVPFRIGQSLAKEREGRPLWTDLTDVVKAPQGDRDNDLQEMVHAFAFMLEYQGTALRARQYPYVLQEGDGGALVLVHDKERDRSWLHGDPLLTAYADARYRRRPPLGDFVQQLLFENKWVKLSLVADHTAQSRGKAGSADPFFKQGTTKTVRVENYRLDADSVAVRRTSSLGDLPVRGWLRPHSDLGTEIQLHRETRGLDSLSGRTGLARILHRPSSIALRGRPVTAVAGEKELHGRAPKIISDMLRLHPFYALQGPPGTGKSTVASRALRDFLATERGARVLVSAQSNSALDELGGKIVKELTEKIEKRSVLVLRELSPSKDPAELPPGLRRLTAEHLTQDLVAHIEQRVDEGCAAACDDDERKLMQEWADLARPNMTELTERIRSGADIVLATCSISGTLTDDVRDPTDLFDWVIIEEAAKAWPTEIVMPLVLGVRWTLIGDYLQLGPHRANDIDTFLNGLADHKGERIEFHYANRDSYLKFVHMFRRFFEGRTPGDVANAANPVDVLDTQFRMHPDIALPFATTFYPSAAPEGSAEPGHTDLPEDLHLATFLQPGPQLAKFHRFKKPPYLKEAPLVWLDTSDSEGCGDQGFWWNPGEADLVRDLVRELGLQDRSDPTELTVLTPYRRQVEELDSGFLEGRVRTVHSFQGGQARTVIISMVRSGDHGEDSRWNVGHTAQPEVMNVMLSRAEELLVVVGDLSHYERHGGAQWQKIIRVFRKAGAVVDAATGEIISRPAGTMDDTAGDLR
ncbi:hypothetical protein GTY40_17395 [Streptomyces sp. SID8359]|uniref:AAA domain-containing protein n=1 Tax=unclassified Streptomyces TaxID=2593676 RepID=UPI00048C2E26|nr:AAA domain-containing protein [Streptomyces sp. SolWspMP-sol2th]MYT92808.1 hypothetical protein [Streptomyces sp. SID8359]